MEITPLKVETKPNRQSRTVRVGGRRHGQKHSRPNSRRQCLGDLFPESLRARLPRSLRHARPGSVQTQGHLAENRPTADVDVHSLRVEARRLDGVRRALRALGLIGFDLIRLRSSIYVVREPILDDGRRASPRRRRTLRSLVRVTGWEDHQPTGIEFQDALSQESA